MCVCKRTNSKLLLVSLWRLLPLFFIKAVIVKLAYVYPVNVTTLQPSIMLNTEIRRLDSNKVSLMSSIDPVSITFLAWLFLGEPITLLQAVETAFV
jgi:drug/metabolite transporter (DMT)-like permease